MVELERDEARQALLIEQTKVLTQGAHSCSTEKPPRLGRYHSGMLFIVYLVQMCELFAPASGQFYYNLAFTQYATFSVADAFAHTMSEIKFSVSGSTKIFNYIYSDIRYSVIHSIFTVNGNTWTRAEPIDYNICPVGWSKFLHDSRTSIIRPNS